MKLKKLRQTTAMLFFIAIYCGRPNAQADQTEYKTKSGKTIIITETHPSGQSISNIKVISQGFEYNLNQTIEDADPVKDVIISDLDNNGFDEIYIFTTSAGSGSYGNILAFSSNKDKSLSMINFPDIEEGDKRFDGYMGHDSFDITNNSLVRVFPIYLESDSNRNPTGGRRAITYGLYPGEAAWQLRIEKVEDVN
jgi:hypothetical protein